MTLIFSFRIKDAVVVIADRLVIGKDGSYDFRDDEERRQRMDNLSKIEEIPEKSLIFSGAGDSELLKFFIDKINIKSNLEEFLRDFEEICLSLRTGGEFEYSVKETEFFLIDQSTLKVFKLMNGKYEEVKEICFLGQIKKLNNFNDVKLKLKRREDYVYNKDNEDALIEWIYCLEDLAKQKLSCIGHPAIDGCDIWIIGKKNTHKISVAPKNYSWREDVR